MRAKLVVATLAAALAALPQHVLAEEPQAEPSLQQVLHDVPLVDGHNDLIIQFIDFDTGELKDADAYEIRAETPGQSDIPRMREGMLGAAIFTIWTPDDNAPEAGLEASVALMHELARRSPDDLAVVTSPDELLSAHVEGRIGIMMGLEGGNPVEGDIGRLEWMRDRGVVEMGLVWSTNDLGTAGRENETSDGLTDLGEQVVREMNRLGMLVDVSHGSPATVADVAAVTSAPVIDTHAYAAGFNGGDGARTDASMLAVASTGGIVMPMFMPDGVDPAYREWMNERNAQFTQAAIQVLGEEEGQYATHFLPWPDGVAPIMEGWIAANPPPVIGIEGIADVYDYVRNLVGIDHIGVGSDFDGMGFHPSGWHPGLRDVSRLPALLEELRSRGWSDDDLRKLAGGNFLRVWREVQAAAAGN